MLKTTINKLLMFIYFICGALILEAVAFHILNFGVMPELFWYNFAVILFLAITVFMIPNYTAQYVVYTIILTIQVILIYVNYSLVTIYGDLFSVDMIRLVKEAGLAITSNFVYFSVILQLIAVYLAIVILGGLALKFCRTEKINFKQHFSIFNIIIFLIIQCCSSGYYFSTRDRINTSAYIEDDAYFLSDKFLMNTSILKTSSYVKFGTYGYFANIIANAIRKDGADIKNLTVKFFESGNTYNGNSSDVFGIDEGNNVIVIMMESMEWFCFGDGNYDKKFNNLSPELTPNIYSLIYGDDYLTDASNQNENNDGLVMKNFFAKSKTNISEGQGIIGNYPIGESLIDVVSLDNSQSHVLGYAMPYVLKNLGYTTTYLHSNDISVYERNLTHNYLGFDNVIGKDMLKDQNGKPIYTWEELKWGNWGSEGDFIRNSMNYLIPENYNEKPFYSFYLNVSSHGGYEYNHMNVDGVRYKDYVKFGKHCGDPDADGYYKFTLNVSQDELPNYYTEWYSNVLKNYGNDRELCDMLLYYQCGAMGLDEAIGVIKKQLVDYGIEDKTTLLLYSDHYSYYNSLSNKVKGFDENDHNSKDLNTIPMIISSPGLKAKNATLQDKYTVNNRFCSAYDVVPTLFDLLGVEFNENFYLGHSLFRPADYVDEERGVDIVVYYSNTGGLFSNDIYSFDMKTFYSQSHITGQMLELFKAETRSILKKINYISLLNRYNLYGQITNK